MRKAPPILPEGEGMEKIEAKIVFFESFFSSSL